MTECSICCEKFNKTDKCPIFCNNCDEDFISCRSCCKRYILESNDNPKCMGCNVYWEQEIIVNNFPKNFINTDLKFHKEKICFDKEIAKLPETVKHAKMIQYVGGLQKQKEILINKKKELQRQLEKYKSDIANIENEIYTVCNDKSKDKIENFTFKCPLENCNGFLNKKLICELCEKHICKDCFEEKLEDHECDPVKVETVKMIKKEAKPCPTCSEMISKIDGCDQMYCIKCHTAFDWKTGQIEKGNIHNPEYFRFLRENGNIIPRNPNDIPICDQFPRLGDISSQITEFYNKNRSLLFGVNFEEMELVKDISANIYRFKLHIDNKEQIYINNDEELDRKLLNLRSYYLLNRISKSYFKEKVQIIYRKKEIEERKINIWKMLKMLIIEYIGKLSELDKLSYKEGISFIETLKNVDKVENFINNELKKIGEMYSVVYPGIVNWIEIENMKTFLKKK